jgi:uncharacterized protein DUF4136
MQRTALILTVLAVWLVGCGAPQVQVLTHRDEKYDFAALHKYGWERLEMRDRVPQGIPKPEELDAMVQHAVEYELQESGYQKSETPDFLVTFRVMVSDRQDNPTVQHHTVTGFDAEKDAQLYQKTGAIVLDVIDAHTQDLVWRGAGITPIEVGKGRKRVDDVVDKIVAEFPHR